MNEKSLVEGIKSITSESWDNWANPCAATTGTVYHKTICEVPRCYLLKGLKLKLLAEGIIVKSISCPQRRRENIKVRLYSKHSPLWYFKPIGLYRDLLSKNLSFQYQIIFCNSFVLKSEFTLVKLFSKDEIFMMVWENGHIKYSRMVSLKTKMLEKTLLEEHYGALSSDHFWKIHLIKTKR